MAERPKSEVPHAASIGSIIVGVAPIIVLANWWDVPLKITVGYGVLAWVAAVLLKTAIHQLVIDRVVRQGASHRAVAAIQGLLSASTELGVAAVFFMYIWQPATMAELIGFGAGAGMAEAVILPSLKNPLKGTSLELHATEVLACTGGDSTIQWLSVLERVLATVLHIASRSLVYLTFLSSNPLPAVLAVGGFSCVDGVAYYGHLKKWRFDSVRTLASMYGYIGGIAAALTGIFVIFARLFDAPA